MANCQSTDREKFVCTWLWQAPGRATEVASEILKAESPEDAVDKCFEELPAMVAEHSGNINAAVMVTPLANISGGGLVADVSVYEATLVDEDLERPAEHVAGGINNS